MRTRLFVALALALATVVPAAAQTYTVAPVPRLEFYDNSGNPCDGCKLYVYASGTETLQDTYKTPSGTVNANPIIMNSAGRPSASGVEVGVYLDALSYKFVFTTSADVTLWTQDTVAATHANVQVVTGTGDITIALDSDNDGSNKLTLTDGTDVERFAVTEAGDVQLDDDLTVGDATAADHDLILDGNAQDFYACLDDSVDDLVIGLGAVCGTTPAIAVDENQDVTLYGGDLVSDDTTYNLFNATVTTANYFGAATAITHGAATGYTNIRHSLFINDTANGQSTMGFAVNMGGADDEIAAFKSSDVAHGVTDNTETDTFAAFRKDSASAGGLRLSGYLATGAKRALNLTGSITDEADTTHTAAAVGVVHADASLKSGTGTTVIATNGNLFVVSSNTSARFIVDAEGDTFQDGTAGTAYADYDDPMLALAVEHHINPKGVSDFFQQYTAYNKQTLVDAGILAPDGPDGSRGFMNMSALTRLAVGSAWQLGIKAQQQQQRIDALEAENLALAARLAAIEATLARSTAQALGGK